jgi:hypothetical protein
MIVRPDHRKASEYHYLLASIYVVFTGKRQEHLSVPSNYFSSRTLILPGAVRVLTTLPMRTSSLWTVHQYTYRYRRTKYQYKTGIDHV